MERDEIEQIEQEEAALYEVKLDVFEGPMDLLLYLIRKDELDIYDIPIAHITTRYLGFLQHIHQLDIEQASDFILMAATLMRIKSQMMLPREELGLDGEDEGDPKAELVRRLLEYQQFKDIADWLGVRKDERRDVYLRRQGLVTASRIGPVAARIALRPIGRVQARTRHGARKPSTPNRRGRNLGRRAHRPSVGGTRAPLAHQLHGPTPRPRPPNPNRHLCRSPRATQVAARPRAAGAALRRDLDRAIANPTHRSGGYSDP